MNKQQTYNCTQAVEHIHRILDGDAVTEPKLAEHLEHCPTCRGFEREMNGLMAGLRQLPQVGMDDATLDRVFQSTTRRSSGGAGASPDGARLGLARLRGWGLDWRAAAAVLAVGLTVSVWWFAGQRSAQPTVAPEELARAEAEARLVLKLAADAMRRSQAAGVRGVLADEVRPALQRVPVRLPAARGKGGS